MPIGAQDIALILGKIPRFSGLADLFRRDLRRSKKPRDQCPVDNMRKNNPKLKTTAQALRRNMTKEERHLWYDALRGYSPRFTRQHPLGNYIVDFYCAAAHLAVELDGGQHCEAENAAKDAERTRQLEQLGIAVIRFPNNAVNCSFRAVCDSVDRCVKARLAGEPMPNVSAELII